MNDYPKMKTSVNVKRLMGEYEITQRTADGYFEANNFLKQWNESKSGGRRYINEFLESPKTKLYIEAIIEGETHARESVDGDFQAVVRVKGKNTKNGKNPDKVFMHPYLYTDFAMWINPKFKYQVIKFVYDQLIEYRHAAGLGNNHLMDAISRTWNTEFQGSFAGVNKALNYIVFGESYRGIRNYATVEQLKNMYEMQRIYGYNVTSGIINDFDCLKLHLRKEYVRRHVPNHKTLRNKK